MAEGTSIEALAELIAGARRIVAFTGAGISTGSGIPDFRGPQGVWTKLEPSDFTIEKYTGSAEHRARMWRMRVERVSVTYEPNPAHRALVHLERDGRLDCIVTQNIDGLHRAAGSSTVLELHGNPSVVRCLDCDRRQPADDVYARVRNGEEDPRCRDCAGILKTCTILFNEAMPADVVEEAYRRARACDLCVVVGSSLVVYPAADVPMEAVRHGARLAIVNNEETPLDGLATVVVHDDAATVLPDAVTRARAVRGSDVPLVE